MLDIGYKGKVAVVTGAASGIGKSTAEILVELGADVYAMDISSRTGLARAFSNFLSTDKGQLIVLKAGMMPTTQQVVIKPVKITE